VENHHRNIAAMMAVTAPFMFHLPSRNIPEVWRQRLHRFSG
jgi:hypothetical protein